MKKILKHTSLVMILVFVLIIPFFVFAGSPTDLLKETAGAGGYSSSTTDTSFAAIVGLAIKIFLSILGIIFIVLILYAGYNWMTARGDEQKVTSAKQTLQRAIIGLIIIISANIIWWTIYTNFIIPALN